MTDTVNAAEAPAGTPAGAPADGVIRLGGAAKPVAMRDLFEIDGKMYQVPSEIRPNVALAILAKYEQMGPGLAEVYMLRRILGDESFNALMEYDGLAPEDLGAITDALMKLTFGAVENESGN